MPSYRVKYLDKNKRRKNEEIIAPSIDEAEQILKKIASKIISIDKLDSSFKNVAISSF